MSLIGSNQCLGSKVRRTVRGDELFRKRRTRTLKGLNVAEFFNATAKRSIDHPHTVIPRRVSDHTLVLTKAVAGATRMYANKARSDRYLA